MGRRHWVRTAGALAAAAVALLAAACSSDEPPPAPEHLVHFSATGSAGGTAFGRYVPVNDLAGNTQVTFSGLPFDLTLPVSYTPQPKMQVSLVNVPPNSRLTCQIAVDGRVVVSQTVAAPGQDAICIAP